MTRQSTFSFATRVTAVVVLMMCVLGTATVTAAGDRTPPTTPTNLRVTGMTAHSVSLAWNPSTDKSGQVTYVICCANVSSETFPGPASTHVYQAGLEPGRSFTLRIVARDAAGNYSKYSNTVTFTLPRDTIPPTAPNIALTDVGPTHVSLAWSSTDDGPHIWFTVFMNGTPISQASRNTSGTFGLLEPETTYTFTAQARDFGGNVSPISPPLTVTTEPSNPDDVTPPTTPTNLWEQHWGEEIELNWTQSTDDLDAQQFIRYDIYVNGAFDHSTVGRGQTIVYGTTGFNTLSVIAVDTASNESVPATITLDTTQP